MSERPRAERAQEFLRERNYYAVTLCYLSVVMACWVVLGWG